MGGGGPAPNARRQQKLSSKGESSFDVDRCDITITTPLAHVRTADVAQVKVGDILNVEIVLASNRKTVACHRQGNGVLIGFVLARRAVQLIECIEQDHVYKAEVKRADFGLVEVTIRRIP